jgi:hypothetical protein
MAVTSKSEPSKFFTSDESDSSSYVSDPLQLTTARSAGLPTTEPEAPTTKAVVTFL